MKTPSIICCPLNALNSFRRFSRNVLSIMQAYVVIIFNLPLLVSVIISVLVEPSSQETTDGFRKLEIDLLRAWHTKAVKGKSGKLLQILTET